MNAILIIILVVVILISISTAFRYLNPDYLVRKSKPLLNSAGQTEFKADLLHMPGSSRYFYEGWFYIHNNAPVYSLNVLFNRGNELVVGLLGSRLNVYVNTKLNGGNGVNADGVLDISGIKPIVSIPDFPFQKWVQIVIYVDHTIVDVYLDGKMVQSVKNEIPVGVSPDSPIRYGNKYTVGEIARFRRTVGSVNPQTVWNSYTMGSGYRNTKEDYHVDAQLTKNRNVWFSQRIF